jgi:quinol monooxygenase YgiN
MVQLILRLTAATGRAGQLVEALSPHVRRATRSAGCRAAHLATDVASADVFWYCEEWDDAGALEARVRTDQFAQILAVMETSAEPPVLEFRVIEQSKGLEYVAAVRGGEPGRRP